MMAFVRFLAMLALIPVGVVTFALLIPTFIIDLARQDDDCTTMNVVIWPWVILTEFIFE